jgi:hypothetical protein
MMVLWRNAMLIGLTGDREVSAIWCSAREQRQPVYGGRGGNARDKVQLQFCGDYPNMLVLLSHMSVGPKLPANRKF